MRGRRTSHPALSRCEATSATQAHRKALDGADVVSVGPAGVITSSWRCSARAERRAAADRTGLLHSLAAAARSVPASQRLQSGRRDVSLRTGCEKSPLSVTYMYTCSSVRVAADNVQADFFAVAAYMKSTRRLNLSRLCWSGWLSQHPILMKTPVEDSFLWGFESNMHSACTQHAFLQTSKAIEQSRRRALAAWQWMQRRWAALSRARGGVPGRCRRQ